MSSPQAPHLNPLAPQRVRRLAPSACLGAEKGNGGESMDGAWRSYNRSKNLAELYLPKTSIYIYTYINKCSSNHGY